MGLLDTSVLRQALDRGQNPNLFPDVTDPFLAKTELENAIRRSSFDVETNPTNFRNFVNSENTSTTQLTEFIANSEYTMFNRFKVYINGPDLSQFGYPKTGLWNKMIFSTEIVEMPRKSMNTIPYQLNSLPILYLPISLSYDNALTITFRGHRDYIQRDAFLKWQELIYPTLKTLNPNSVKESIVLDANSGLNYYDVYAKNFSITVTSLNLQGQSTMITKFYGVYPAVVEGYNHDWSNSDYVKQNITFSFYKFHTVTASEA